MGRAGGHLPHQREFFQFQQLVAHPQARPNVLSDFEKDLPAVSGELQVGIADRHGDTLAEGGAAFAFLIQHGLTPADTLNHLLQFSEALGGYSRENLPQHLLPLKTEQLCRRLVPFQNAITFIE